jgi:N-methylhydantoinase A/oxoprolinase/acetone carboxylase beta subunit
MLRLGIDIGGTFTDFVVFNPQTGQVETFKLLSTPHDPPRLSWLDCSNWLLYRSTP